MRKSFLSLALTAMLACALPAMGEAKESCVVSTYDQAGVYLASVQTADGVPLLRAEAATITDLLNSRHNQGDNPVEARFTCS